MISMLLGHLSHTADLLPLVHHHASCDIGCPSSIVNNITFYLLENYKINCYHFGFLSLSRIRGISNFEMYDPCGLMGWVNYAKKAIFSKSFLLPLHL